MHVRGVRRRGRRRTEEAVSRRAEVDVQDDRPREVDAREGDVLVPAGERGEAGAQAGSGADVRLAERLRLRRAPEPVPAGEALADVTDEATLAVDFSDNAADIALRTHSLLAGIRTLASKARIRFISGRPRTRGRLLPGQLTLDLRTADGSVYRL